MTVGTDHHKLMLERLIVWQAKKDAEQCKFWASLSTNPESAQALETMGALIQSRAEQQATEWAEAFVKEYGHGD